MLDSLNVQSTQYSGNRVFPANPIGSTDVRDNPANFTILSDDDATVTVQGWYCKVLRRG